MLLYGLAIITFIYLMLIVLKLIDDIKSSWLVTLTSIIWIPILICLSIVLVIISFAVLVVILFIIFLIITLISILAISLIIFNILVAS
jgi:hypothetical protein